METHIKTYLLALLICLPLLGLSQANISPNVSFQNKNIPTILFNEIKVALSYFPELKDTRIDFVMKDKIKHATMQAQPRVKTLFKGKAKRSYKIKIKRLLQFGAKTRAIQTLPSDVIVGWMAHELGHIMDYLDRSSIQMVGFGLKYITSRPFLMQAEVAADRHAISHGFAEEIIRTKEFILGTEDLPKNYRNRIDQLYLSPKEIRAVQADLGAN